MDEINRLQSELRSVMRELLDRDPNAIQRILDSLREESEPVTKPWPKMQDHWAS